MKCADTIVAVSTAQGAGAISIVRVSGDKAFFIGEKIFKSKNKFSDIPSHTINYGYIIDDQTNEVIDEVLVSKMASPHTFTKEDIVEVNCHGGTVMTRRILELIVKKGARFADPGEFTKRAFLNGRIDLSQAEAIIDIINSKTDESSRAAISQLRGSLSGKIKKAKEILIRIIAHIEAVLEYPEEDIEDINDNYLYKDINEVKVLIRSIEKGFERGKIINEGVHVVIVGRPNVGKSSLLNELSGKDKAIVTDIPGTTRDLIEEFIDIKGIPVKIVDTAGIRETEDIIEKIGVEKTHQILDEADLAIVMLDASQKVSQEDLDFLETLKYRLFKEQDHVVLEPRILVVLNKIDLITSDELEEIKVRITGEKVVCISILEQNGIEDLELNIKKMFFNDEIGINSELLISNVRQRELISQAAKSLDEAIEAYDNKIPIDLIAIDMRMTADFLGQMIGESVNEDVVNEIFKRFCIGK